MTTLTKDELTLRERLKRCGSFGGFQERVDRIYICYLYRRMEYVLKHQASNLSRTEFYDIRAMSTISNIFWHCGHVSANFKGFWHLHQSQCNCRRSKMSEEILILRYFVGHLMEEIFFSFLDGSRFLHIKILHELSVGLFISSYYTEVGLNLDNIFPWAQCF